MAIARAASGVSGCDPAGQVLALGDRAAGQRPGHVGDRPGRHRKRRDAHAGEDRGERGIGRGPAADAHGLARGAPGLGAGGDEPQQGRLICHGLTARRTERARRAFASGDGDACRTARLSRVSHRPHADRSTDQALCERLSFVAAGEQITDIVKTLLNC